MFIGDASYAIYLTHSIVIAMMKGSSDFTTFVVCIVVGMAVYVTIEKPITTWLKRARIGPLSRGRAMLESGI
jgi:peptidoglycan/LPS O-acetylase OafA/YrhL